MIRRIVSLEKSAGGIIFSDRVYGRPVQGEVIAAGAVARNQQGTLKALDLNPYDRVLFGTWSGTRSDPLDAVDGARTLAKAA